MLPLERVVLGLGNPLLGDEGVGLQALKASRIQLEKHYDVAWLDGGAQGLDLLPVVECSRQLLILDAVDGGGCPGDVVEVRGTDIPLYSGLRLSQHQVTFQDVLGLAVVRDRLPVELCLLGIQVGELASTTSLSLPVAAALPRVVQRVEWILESWVK